MNLNTSIKLWNNTVNCKNAEEKVCKLKKLENLKSKKNKTNPNENRWRLVKDIWKV